MERIKEILELGQISRHLAIISTDTGREIKIPWKGLQTYWAHAYYDEIDFISASLIDELLVICMTAACGQSGIIAVWDLSKEDWIHMQKGDYVYCALLIKEFGMLVSLHYISDGSTSGYQTVFANRLSTGGTKLDNRLIIEIKAEWDEKEFRPKGHEISQEARLDTVQEWHKKCGPSGLFYSSKQGVIYAHDACNLAVIKVDDIIKKLDK